MRRLFRFRKYPNLGLLMIRLALAVFFIQHGYGKMFNPSRWAWLGAQVPFLEELVVLHKPLGFVASFSEFFGGIALFFGVFIRPFMFLLSITMGVATYFHYQQGDNMELPLLYAILFCAMLFIGADRFSVDSVFRHK